MGGFSRLVDVLRGPTLQPVFTLVVSIKPERDDIPPSKDDLGALPYRKIAVYSSLEKAVRAAAWEAASEHWILQGFPEGGFATKEENDRWVPIREAEKRRAEAAKKAMLDPSTWSSYESTDGKIVWFHEGPTAFDYRVILNRVDRWAELPVTITEMVGQL
jgi:hypothetical protein